MITVSQPKTIEVLGQLIQGQMNLERLMVRHHSSLCDNFKRLEVKTEETNNLLERIAMLLERCPDSRE